VVHEEFGTERIQRWVGRFFDSGCIDPTVVRARVISVDSNCQKRDDDKKRYALSSRHGRSPLAANLRARRPGDRLRRSQSFLFSWGVVPSSTNLQFFV
jgi:hypothetical protein